jgi:ribosomal protein S3
MGQKTNHNIFRLGVNKKWKTEFFEKKTKEFAYFTFADLEIKSYIERFLSIYGLILHDYKIHHTNSVLNIYISYVVTPDFKFNNIKQSKKLKLISKTKKQKFIYLNTEQRIKKKNSLFLKVEKYLKHNKSNPEEFRGNSIAILQTNTSEPTQQTNLRNLRIENKIQKFLKSLELFKNSSVLINFKCINKTFNLATKQKKSLKKKIMLLQKFRYTPFFKEGINLIFLSVYKHKSSKLLTKFIEMQLKKIKRHKFFFTFLKKTLTLFLNSNFSKIKGVRIKIKGRLNGAPRAKHKILDVGDIPVQTIDSVLDYSEATIHNLNGSYGIKVWVIEKNTNN